MFAETDVGGQVRFLLFFWCFSSSGTPVINWQPADRPSGYFLSKNSLKRLHLKKQFPRSLQCEKWGEWSYGMFANPKEIQLLPMNSWKASLSASPTLELIFWLYKNPCPKTFRLKFTPEKGSQTIGIPFCKQYKRAFPSHQPGVNNAAVLRFRRIMVNPVRSIQVHGCRRDIETTWCVSRIFLYHSRATSADPCIPHKPPYDCYRNKTPI